MNTGPGTTSAVIDSNAAYVQTLPVELVAALRRTAGETLRSLLSLRIALRDHVRAERSDGASLSEIDSALREMIIVAGGDPSGANYSAERMDELTTHVLKWSESFYSPSSTYGHPRSRG